MCENFELNKNNWNQNYHHDFNRRKATWWIHTWKKWFNILYNILYNIFTCNNNEIYLSLANNGNLNNRWHFFTDFKTPQIECHIILATWYFKRYKNQVCLFAEFNLWPIKKNRFLCLFKISKQLCYEEIWLEYRYKK